MFQQLRIVSVSGSDAIIAGETMSRGVAKSGYAIGFFVAAVLLAVRVGGSSSTARDGDMLRSGTATREVSPPTDRDGSKDRADVPRAATIFTAVEEQSGLRLQPIRVPREFIVIDRIERLSPN